MSAISTTRIFMSLSAAFEAEHGIKLHRDWIALIRMMDAADNAREKLATSESVIVDLPYIYGPARLTVSIRRADLMARRK
jgi:molecular chaperone DnaK (HSP70)